MRKTFFVSVFICFVIAMLITTQFPKVVSNDTPKSNNITSETVNIADKTKTDNKDDTPSSKETQTKKETASKTTEVPASKPVEIKVLNATEENSYEDLNVKITETNADKPEIKLIKGEKNKIINFDKSASNVSFAGRFRLTAYCSCSECCDEYGENRPIDKNGNKIVKTATGTNALENRTIAVDPRVIPYGTTVVIEQDGVFYEYVAEDCGGAIKNKRIDVYFASHNTANEFGIKYGNVYLIRD